jgi:hypothetical protein
MNGFSLFSLSKRDHTFSFFFCFFSTFRIFEFSWLRSLFYFYKSHIHTNRTARARVYAELTTQTLRFFLSVAFFWETEEEEEEEEELHPHAEYRKSEY